MSPSPSDALVSTGQSTSTFSQQGSLDWVALAQTQVQFAVGIVSRLSKAGIEDVTIICGQALCTRLPLGFHGERLIRDTMGTLTARPCAGTLIWFGIGVRHVLWDITRTSQGCSLVALCSALSEACSYEVGALVLHQLTKECRAPEEITPSITQWETLMRVASPVFNKTKFGLRVNQILRLGYRSNTPILLENSHPTQLAKVLLDIGQVVSGSVESVSIQGSGFCSWVAAWTDVVLGLRTLVLDTEGNIVSANFPTASRHPQVVVQFLETDRRSSTSIIRVGKTHSLHSGAAFIQDCFGEDRFLHSRSPHIQFSGGRLEWGSMLEGTFGIRFGCLIRPVVKGGSESLTPPGSPLAEQGGLGSSTYPPADERTLFARLMAAAAFIFCRKDLAVEYHQRPEDYILNACANVNELSECHGAFLSAITEVRQDMLSDTLQSIYRSTTARLAKLCWCISCARTRGTSQHCLVDVAEAVIYLTLLLDRLVFDSEFRLNPTRYGLLRLIWREDPPSPDLESRPNIDSDSLESLYLRLSRNVHENPRSTFSACAPLFSGEIWQESRRPAAAWSDGKIYCYLETLEKLPYSTKEATVVHVGSGGIQYQSRVYYRISDSYLDGFFREFEQRYQSKRVEDVLEASCLENDTTNPEISARILVDERPKDLFVWHEITAEPDKVMIAPTHCWQLLRKALAYQVQESYQPSDVAHWYPVLHNSKFIVFEGEGRAKVDHGAHFHTLRPLRGNLLGRWVALRLHADDYVALVRNQSELEDFARFWAKYRDQCESESGRKAFYYVLIA